MELHLEVDERLTVREAHAVVSEFEENLRRAAPEVAQSELARAG